MVKKKILQEQEISSQPEEVIEGYKGIKRFDPTKRLLNKRFILEAIMECLLNNDADGACEMVQAYLKAVNRANLARDAHVSRSTLEHCLQNKNPTVKTLFKLLAV